MRALIKKITRRFAPHLRRPAPRTVPAAALLLTSLAALLVTSPMHGEEDVIRTMPPPEIERKDVAAALLLENRDRCRTVTSRLVELLSTDFETSQEKRGIVRDYLEREGTAELSVAMRVIEISNRLTSGCDCMTGHEEEALWDMSQALRNFCEVSDKAMTFSRSSFQKRVEKAENSLDEARLRLFRSVPVTSSVRRKVAQVYSQELQAVRRKALALGNPEPEITMTAAEYKRKQEVFARVQEARKEEDARRRRQEAQRRAAQEARRIEAIKKQEAGQDPDVAKADQVMARLRAKELQDWYKVYLASIADVKTLLGQYLAAKKAGKDNRKICFSLAGKCQGLLKGRTIFESPDTDINTHLEKSLRLLGMMGDSCLKGDREQANRQEAAATAELGRTSAALKRYGLSL